MKTEGKKRRFWLAAGVVANLALLGYFKYAGMFSTWVVRAGEHFDLNALSSASVIEVALPIGISFYVFQAISYLIDIYRGDAAPARNLVSFATYIALFPQLIAGPIVRYRTIADQLNKRTHNLERFLLGTRFFSLGLFKKVVIADTIALGVPIAFGSSAPMAMDNVDPTTVESWVGVLCYAFQIYFDFSAYSDMAIGLGLFFGFEFLKNFDSPYKSSSITEFWRRWHISLSSWLRDYLYLPLGGNRKGRRRTYLNLMIVMALGGLWHGASVVFLIWGLWHGALLACERAFAKTHPIFKVSPLIARLITFVLVCIGWVPFRATSLKQAGMILKSMFVPNFGESTMLALFPEAPFALLVCAMLVFFCANSWELIGRCSRLAIARDLLAFWVSIVVILIYGGSPFLYFQF